MSGVFLSDLVECFVRQHGPLLDLEANFQERREGFWHSTCHDESQGPIYGHHEDPDELTPFGYVGLHTEKLHEDVVVYDLDADVSIEGSGNQTTCY